MNLKTFAVRQKLAHNDALLPYVVKNQDVPIHVLEESFRELLTDLVDIRASQLIDDPDTLLGTEVPVLMKRDAQGGYEIEGDIPDTLMEAIQLVHNKTQDAVVKSLVNYNMNMLYGQHCDVVSVELLTDKAIQTVSTLKDMPSIKPLPELLDETAAIDEALDSLPEDVLYMDMPASMTPVPETEETDVPSMDPVLQADELPDMVSQGEAMAEDTTPDGMMTMESEAADAEVMGDDDDFCASVRRIYIKLVNDIKSFGLDKRLSLTI